MKYSEDAKRLGVFSAWLAAAASVVYVAFALAAYSRYPGAFGPLTSNWLSDLGNRQLNPEGATFYVIGCMVAGVLILGFFASLLAWRATGTGRQNWLLVAVQLAGALAASSLIMSAVYTEDMFNEHQFWSRLIYAGFALVFFISPFALRRRGHRLWPLVAVAAAGYVAIVASFIFWEAQWLEWPAVGAILVFVCLVGGMSSSSAYPSASSALGSRPRIAG